MAMSVPPVSEHPFSILLAKAVSEPGVIFRAYTAFYGYSIGNQLLALFQCIERGITPGPIATYISWKDKGRQVRRGEKAIVLCMPVTIKRTVTTEPDGTDAECGAVHTFTKFIYRPHWFVLSQTDGADVAAETLPSWDAAAALRALDVTEEPFAMLDGNCQGYARDRVIAVSPVAAAPHKTRFHELAHVVLGHTAEGELADDERTPRSLREVEAEAVAMICLEALELPGAEFCRGYIQHWNAQRGNDAIPERSAQKIFKAADTILRAGRPSERELLAA